MRFPSRTVMLAIICCAVAAPARATAQATEDQLQILRLFATPIGALPAISLPMPSSRNHSNVIGRFQTGYRKGPSGTSLPATAVGLDLQYQGGSVFGLTAGAQKRDCRIVESCGYHALFGARAQLNMITGGSTLAKLLRDNSTTSTFGAELGAGYAPHVTPKTNACSLDFGLPFSVAKRRQRPRFVGYVTPGIVWDTDCGSNNLLKDHTYFTGFGFGFQQVMNRSLDIYFGFQKVFRRDTGSEIGITVSYVKLPK
ncbi:MAG TPA: hypothetical protein VM053_02630 [Gemmatimonadaceae bacterium]|nr:hypothetical protein [Gemmatimonadaceae bacterium]